MKIFYLNERHSIIVNVKRASRYDTTLLRTEVIVNMFPKTCYVRLQSPKEKKKPKFHKEISSSSLFKNFLQKLIISLAILGAKIVLEGHKVENGDKISCQGCRKHG